MDIKLRDERLKQFFSEDILGQLDEAEKNVLSEEFSNNDLRVLSSQPLETVKARVSKSTSAEYQRRLQFIQPEEYHILKEWYLEVCKSVEELYCTKCGVLLGLEVDTIDDNMNANHHEGKFIVQVGPALMAYRPRLDGVMGYQCGNVYENPDPKVRKAWAKFESDKKEKDATFQADIQRFEEEAAEWNKLSDEEKQETPGPAEPKFLTLTSPKEPLYIECDNDTRWAQIEEDNIDVSHVMTSLTKEDIVKVKREIDATGYTPDIKKTKKGRKVETFELRKVK